MRRHALLSLAVATALSLSLAGCFGLGPVGSAVSDAADAAGRIADAATSATDAASALADVEWGKLSRAVVRDASSGEKIREVTDQATIEDAFAGLSDECGLTTEPDAAAEYAIEVWQPRTETLADDAGTDDVQVLEVTTYEGSDAVTLEVTPIGLTLTLAPPAGAADALRSLAR